MDPAKIKADFDAGMSWHEVAQKHNLSSGEAARSAVRRWLADNDGNEDHASWRETRDRDTWVIELNDSRINTVDDALKKANVNTDIWEVERVVVNGWDVTMKLRDGDKDKPYRSQNSQIKVWLRRKVPVDTEEAVNRLLEKLEKKSPGAPKIKRLPPSKLPHRHALEICLMDIHYGLRCYPPSADIEWNPETCARIVMASVDEMLAMAEAYAPFEEILLPLGNDWFTVDSKWMTTTGGTAQQDGDTYYPTFIGGEELAIAVVDRVKQRADVRVVMMPGNHDETTSFMLGRVLKAYYRNDKNVTVDADPNPYKFWEYGCNLVGFEHGHGVNAVRLAALMANEAPDAWARTKNGYREWHLGDQHRKGTSKPSALEEQGVSIEYLPALVAPNEWHRRKSFNWQNRGTMGFVWHHSAGPIARLQVNIDRYVNAIMGKR